MNNQEIVANIIIEMIKMNSIISSQEITEAYAIIHQALLDSQEKEQ